MNRKLEKLSGKQNFDEILKIIESKTIKPSLLYKDLNLTEADFLQLRKFTTGCILKALHSGNSIPNSLISISLLLGPHHMDALRSSICNFIISRKMLDISQFIQDHFQDISSLGKIFYFIENTLEITYKEYENLPHSWNLDLKILIRSLVTLKQVICEYFFSNEPTQEALAEGINISIAFEKKLNEFFNLKKCCISSIEFHEEECFIRSNPGDVKCVHKRMISSLFIPYIDIFIDYHLSKILTVDFDQSKTEKTILKHFVDYFKCLESVYDILCHFEEKSIFSDLFNICDKVLLALLQKVRLDEDSNKIIVLYSTILYVQKVIEDFSSKLTEKFQFECNSRSLAASRKLERSLDSKIEKEIFNNYPETIMKLPDTLQECFNNFSNFDDEVKKNILEICIIQLLLKVGKVKLNQTKAEELINQIIDLEILIVKRFKVSVSAGIIKDYLSIFVCPIDLPNLFIENFKKFSTGKFDLNQILKALEDQQAAHSIYQHFKNCND